jgi:two-component system OmpR family sensor kinase
VSATVRSSHSGASIDPEWLVNQIAHALRNPIFAATVQAEALVLKAGGQEGLARSAEMVQGQLKRLEEDLQEMLLLGRPARMNPRPMDLVAVAGGVVDSFRDGLAGEAADVQLRRPVGSVALISDDNAIRIILERLIINAVQHTQPPHSIEVEVAEAGDAGATVEVRDAGGGITPDLLDKIFLPFFPQHRGRPGLGLAVAAKFAHALGGVIEVESEPGVGTIARVVLSASPQADGR